MSFLSRLAPWKIISTSSSGVIQTFGRFTGIAKPGLNFKIPIAQVISDVSHRQILSSFKFEAKTKDNVFTTLGISVLHQIKQENTEKAFFAFYDPIEQINSSVQNVIRARVPEMDVRELFVKQSEIAEAVKNSIAIKMESHGFTIIDVLVTEIDPAKAVKDKLNSVQAAKLARDAAEYEGDAEKIKKIKEAEGDKQRKILQGEGISGQRAAIMKGYQDGVGAMAQQFGMKPLDIVNFIKDMQSIDAMESIGKSQGTKTLFFPSSGNRTVDLNDQGNMKAIEESIMKAIEGTK